jgi:hypothetical protein
MEIEMANSKKAVLALGATLLLGVGGWFAATHLINQEGGMPEKLYRYYPDSSAFYMELAPTRVFVDRFVHGLQQQIRQSASTHQGERSPDSSLTTQKSSDYRQLFLDRFNNTFKPCISLGMWKSSLSSALSSERSPASAQGQNLDTGLSSQTANILIVLSLKSPASLLDIMQRFNLSIEAFEQKSDAPVVYIVEKSSGHAITVLNQNILITNQSAAMKDCLQHYQQKKKHIFQNAEIQPYLSQLPKERQGTIILNNQSYFARTGSQPVNASSAVTPESFSTVLPLTVADVHFNETQQQVSSHWISPVRLDKLTVTPQNQQLVEALQQLLQPRAQFMDDLASDTLFAVSIAHLDNWFDAYEHSMLSAKSKQWIKLADAGLSKINLDLRQDVISLLSGQTLFIGAPLPAMDFSGNSSDTQDASTGLVVQLEKNATKIETFNKIETTLSTALKANNPAYKSLQAKPADETSPVRIIRYGAYTQNQDSALAYGNKGRFILLSTPEVLTSVFERTRQSQVRRLAASREFQSLMNNIPEQVNLLAYINVAALREKQDVNSGAFILPDWLKSVGGSIWTVSAVNKKALQSTLIHGQLNFRLSPELPFTE